MRQNKNTWFYIGRAGLDQTDDFQKFCRTGLDRIQFYRIRTGFGLKNLTVRSSLLPCAFQRWVRTSTSSDWIRTEANFGRIRTGSDCNFFESFRIRIGSDWESFSCFNVIILTISKSLVRFYRFVKWLVSLLGLFCYSNWNCIHLCPH